MDDERALANLTVPTFLGRLAFGTTVLLAQLMMSSPAEAQLNEDCVASVLNRTVRVDDDGSFFIADLPVQAGLHRVRVTCTRDGEPVEMGQSDLFELSAGGFIELGPIAFGNVDPIPVALEVTAETTRLTAPGETVQLVVKGLLADGTLIDLTSEEKGTTYASSSPSVAELDDDVDGLVRALTRGRVSIGVRHEGVVSSIEIEVAIPNDADEDGLPDEFESANGLDPQNPDDALEDPDGDGLSNRDEFLIGTDIFLADTDVDGIPDPEEGRIGTEATNPDTDGDGLLDGEEIEIGTSPFLADTDGDGISDGTEAALLIDPLVANQTTTVVGVVVDTTGAAVSGAAAVAFGRFAVTTDFDGGFTIPNVPADQGELVIFARRIEEGRVLDGRSIPTSPVAFGVSDVGDVEISEISGRITGRILNPFGAPVASARVTIRSGIDERQINADITGVYEIDRLPPGPIEVRALDPRTALRGRVFSELPDVGSEIVDIKLGASGTFLGAVFERDDETPEGAGATVEAFRGNFLEQATETNEVGEYVVDFVPLGDYRLEADDLVDERGQARAALTVTSQVIEADITYLGKGRVSGVVETLGGDRVPNADVSVFYQGVFRDQRTLATTADGAGEFSVDGVFVGEYTATALDPATNLAGLTKGNLLFDGDRDVIKIIVGDVGHLTGTVFETDGVTPVPNATVVGSPAGFAVADAAGTYSIRNLPLPQNYGLRASHPDSSDCGFNGASLSVPGLTVGRDIVMRGFGELQVEVRYADGSPVAGVMVTIEPDPPNCGAARSAETGPSGLALFEDVHVGSFVVGVAEPLCGLGRSGRVFVPRDEVTEVSFTFSAFGTITGTVFGSDAVTPVPGINVSGASTSNKSGPAGRYTLTCVQEGNHQLTASDQFGSVLARETDVVLSKHGEIVERDLVLVPRGTVEGTVTDPNGDVAPNVGVQLTPIGFSGRFGRTDVNGFYRIERVPASNLVVTAIDNRRAFQGRVEGELVSEGEVVVIDVEMEGEQIIAELYDANNYVYPVQFPNGGILEGTLGFFRGDDDDNRDGLRLSIGQSGAFEIFEAVDSTFDTDRGEAVLSGLHSSGLEVERRVFIPSTGYFSRYLEVLSNPTGDPIAVDVTVDSFFRPVTNVREGFLFTDFAQIVATSSGDRTLRFDFERDRWFSIGVDLPDGSAVEELLPTFAYVFDGEGGSVEVADGAFTTGTGNFSQVSTTWRTIVVPPGERVILLHFGVQETGAEAARAAAERLSALPPEAVDDLTEDVRGAIVNFVVPAASALEPLPGLEGRVMGTVFEGDGTHPVPGAEVSFRSRHPLFQRVFSVDASADGTYELTGTITGDGNNVVVPLEEFIVQADHPVTFVMSPAVPGEFDVTTEVVRDIVFTDTSRVFGTARRADGAVLSTGQVVLTGVEQILSLRRTLPTDGTFEFIGVPPGSYSIVVTQMHPQGTPLVGTTAVSVPVGGGEVRADVTLAPTGGVEGQVLAGLGFFIVDTEVELLGESFRRVARTDTGGRFQFLDVAIGSYTLRSVEPDTKIPATLGIEIVEDEILLQDVTFTGTGAIDVGAEFTDGAPVDGARILLRSDPLGAQFKSRGTTGSDGTALVADVPVGDFTLRVLHPGNDFISTEVEGTIATPGDVVPVSVVIDIDEPPTVEIVEPASGLEVIQGSRVTAEAVVTDDIKVVEVELLVDGVAKGTSRSEPHRFELTALSETGADEILVTVAATDVGANRTVSDPVTIRLISDLSAPSVAVVAPGPAATFIEGTTVPVTVNALDNIAVETVEIFLNGELEKTLTAPPFTTSITLPRDLASPGPVRATIEARATDRAQNSRTDSVEFNVVPDEPPSIRLLVAPADGTEVQQGATVRFSADATDDVDVQVDLLLNGDVVGTRLAAPFEFDFVAPTTAGDGDVLSMTLRARDTQNQVATTDPVELVVRADPEPTVEIITPADGAEFFEGETVIVRADASDDTGVSQVQFTANTVPIGVDTTAPYEVEYRIESGLDRTPIRIVATVTDTIGQLASDDVLITRREDAESPTLELLSPQPDTVLSLGESDIVILIDTSETSADPIAIDVDGDGVNDNILKLQVAAAKELLSFLNPETTRVALITFRNFAFLRRGLTDDFARLDSDLTSIASIGTSGAPDLGRAIEQANQILTKVPARAAATPIQILFSHRAIAFPADEVAESRNSGILVNTFGVSVGATSRPILQQIADETGGSFNDIIDPADLIATLPELVRFGLDSVPLIAEASDNVSVRDVSFRMQATGIDETVVDDIAPFSTTFGLPGLTEPTELMITASATDFGGNTTTLDPITVDVLPSENPPEISSVEPSPVAPATTVTISGRFFEPEPDKNVVSFAGAPAVVQSSTKVSLTVVVPGAVTDGALTVEVGGRISAPFEYAIDSDGDGLSDEEEGALGTDPSDADTDDDGLSDGDEVQAHGTDPLVADSDGDGLTDGFEVTHGFDPTSPGEEILDSDSDGLTNLEEQTLGTDPTEPDTDRDGLQDGAELTTHGTDPTNPDSDGGGRSDGNEVLVDGTDPLDPADDRVRVPLPTTLIDGDGFTWDVGLRGQIIDGTFDAFDGGFFLRVIQSFTREFPNASDAAVEDADRELRIGPSNLFNLSVTRKVFVPPDEGFVRYLEILENPTADDITATVSIFTNAGADFGIELFTTSSGDQEFDEADDYIIVDDGDETTADGDGLGSPTVAYVFAGPFADRRPSDVNTTVPPNDDISYDFEVTVPAGDRVIVMHFAAQSDDRATALTNADTLRRLRGKTLFGMSRDEQEDVINFFAFADADGDGLSDEDEIAAGTDPDNADSDGDGASDGFEVRNGFDPLDGSDGGADTDFDGLTNAEEDESGTDPRNADTDIDGLNDGDEVNSIGSDPSDADTDDDGLTDGDEVTLHGTSPLLADTDGGGRSDAEELADGTDPLDGEDDRFALPRTLLDSLDFAWDIQTTGRVGRGSVFAFQTTGGYNLTLNDAPFGSFPWALSDDGGRELVIGPWDNGDLRVTRKVYVPEDEAFARYLEVVENVGAAPVDADILVHSRVSVFNLFFVTTSSGDVTFDVRDRWIATDTRSTFGSNPPGVGHVISGPGARSRPTEAFHNGANVIEYRFEETLAPGERVIVMHFGIQSGSTTGVQLQADKLLNREIGSLDGLSEQEKNDIINFFPFPDADFDGISDDDEAAGGTDPANPDSDGDGMDDGFEVRNGFDPLDPADGAADADGDGLDNAGEQSALTDPFDPDTDGDGLSDGDEVLVHGSDPIDTDSDDDGIADGDEVNVHGTDPTREDTDAGGRTDFEEIDTDGTDPLNGADDLQRLPVVINDGLGFRWDIQSNGSITDGSSNAYDGGYRLFVDGVAFPGFTFGAPEDLRREYGIGTSLRSGLEVRRKVFVPDNDDFIRYLEIFDNPGSSTVSATVRIFTNLGSNTDTELVATSSGDLSFTSRDRSIVTDDSNPSGTRPAVAHVFAGPNAQVGASSVSTTAPGDDDIDVFFDISVPPGGTVILMHFAQQSFVRAGAVAKTSALELLEGRATDGLSDAERAAIVNFFALVDTDGDFLSDDDESALGTDPANPDSDGDGLLDGFEVSHGFDPLVSGDGTADPDSDGLDNVSEQAAETDPNDPDTDDDGLTDGVEVLTHGTDPLNEDTDGDGLEDGAEVNSHGTDPLDIDTDGGGESDFEEVSVGRDPLDPFDDIIEVRLPLVQTDGDGFRWDIQRDATIGDGTNNAFDAAFRLLLDGTTFPTFFDVTAEDLGREVIVGTWSQSGLRITRKVFVPDDAAFVRYMDIVENTSFSTERQASIELRTDLGSNVETEIVATSSGDLSFGLEDFYLVTDDGEGSGSPAIAHVFAGASARIAPSRVTTTAPGSDDVSVFYDFIVPPQERVILLHFASQRNSRADSETSALELLFLTGRALGGMSTEELDDVTNFFPFPDADADGLSDDDEAAAGTDPANPDTDGDGLFDGFEVRNGFDPLTPGDGAVDSDGDGLDNQTEQSLGTDPQHADSDRDGLSDGEEVALGANPRAADSDHGGRTDREEIELDGTDPLVGSDDFQSTFLPRTLLDGSSFRWRIDRNGASTDSSAYDFGFQLDIDGRGFFTSAAAAAPDFRTFVIGRAFPTTDIETHRKVFVPADDAFVRYLEIFKNVGATDQTVDIRLRSDLGSDSLTEIVGTGSGDTTLTTDDRFIVTGRADFGFPAAVGHIFAGATGLVAPSNVLTNVPGGDDVDITYRVTIPAGERVLLLHFAIQRSDRAEGTDAAEALARLNASALQGLTPREQDEIVNFFAFVDTDGDRVSDDDELVFGTDPGNPDTDGDSASDGFEVANGLDPLDPADGGADLDGDGLTNAEEERAGTDIRLADTDGDGLSDGDEVNVHGSDPVDPDGDDDGLLDGDEITIGTDPTDADSDDGGRDDGSEVHFDGTDPLDAFDDNLPIQVSDDEAEEPTIAIDGGGNLHLVWQGPICNQVSYSMLTATGDVLIDDTVLVDDSFCFFIGEPIHAALDALDKLHIVYSNGFEVLYLEVDPSLDDQDGSAADAATITVHDRLFVGRGDTAPRIAVDAFQNAHIVYALGGEDEGEGEGDFILELRYAKVTAGGAVSFVKEGADSANLDDSTDVLVDPDGNVHIIGSGFDLFFDERIFYWQFDAASGDLLIDVTELITEEASPREARLGRRPDGTLSLAYRSFVDGSSSILRRVIDPRLDDRNGDSADPAIIVIGADEHVTDVAPGFTITRMAFDSAGNLYLAEQFDEGSPVVRQIVALAVDDAGVDVFARQAAGIVPTVRSLGGTAAVAETLFISWIRRDLDTGRERVFVAIVNPDDDGDGLSNVRELALGTSPTNPDTDGGGRTDGQEVLLDGTDPLDPSDDL